MCNFCQPNKKGAIKVFKLTDNKGWPVRTVTPIYQVVSHDLTTLRINRKKFKHCPMCGRELDLWTK